LRHGVWSDGKRCAAEQQGGRQADPCKSRHDVLHADSPTQPKNIRSAPPVPQVAIAKHFEEDDAVYREVCRLGGSDASDRNNGSFLKIGARIMAVLPSAIRAIWKRERLGGKSHSYREGDTC
jgi:hypothetical protein